MITPFSQDENLSVRIEREGRTARIALAGRVDGDALDAMAAAAARIHPAHDHVILDLTAVTAIDDRGFDHVVATRDALAAIGYRVEVATEADPQLSR